MDCCYHSLAFVLGCSDEFPSLWPSASAAPSAWEWHFLHLGNQRPGVTALYTSFYRAAERVFWSRKNPKPHFYFIVSCLPVQGYPVQPSSANSPFRTSSELTVVCTETTWAGYCPTGAARFEINLMGVLTHIFCKGFFLSLELGVWTPNPTGSEVL